MKELLTNSRTECFFYCMKKHYWEYELGLRSAHDSEALIYGDAFHYGLETKDATKGIGRYDESHGTPHDDLEHEVKRIALFTMLNAYFWRWDADDKANKTQLVEANFSIPLINPDTKRASRTFEAAGKIDAIVTLADGRLAVMEHKTTSFSLDVDSPYWKKLQMDKQISGYFIAAKQLGYDVDTIIYDVAKKPSFTLKTLTQKDTKALIETGKYYDMAYDVHVPATFDTDDGYMDATVGIDGHMAETVPGKKYFAIKETVNMYAARLWHEITSNYDNYFCRKEIPRLEGDIEDYQKDQWNTGQLLMQCKRSERWPKNTSACFGRYGTCPYYDLCVQNFNGESVPEGFVKLDNVHPELLLGDNQNGNENNAEVCTETVTVNQ